MSDSYRTILQPVPEMLYKDRGSKFYVHTFPLTDEAEVADYIGELKNKYPKAGHHCYAWKMGPGADLYRANDDGEPSHSAGDPILGQIQSFELSDVLVVVSRIFGGTKLGVGGLINAYREAAKLSLEQANVVIRTITADVEIMFEYPQMSQVMRYIDENHFKIVSQELSMSCVIKIAVPESDQEKVVAAINNMYPLKAKALD